MKTCSVEGCDKPTVARGLCQRDYTRWQRHGDPTVVKPANQKRAECGTPGGYFRHHRSNEDPCDLCKEAHAAKAKAYRSTPEVKARQNERSKVYSKALWQLSREYPARFLELVDQFKEAP